MKLLFLKLLALLARLGTRRKSAELTRVLILKPDALGDLLLATPALRRLRQGVPKAQITGMVGPWSRVIWAQTPDLDQLYDLPFPGFNRASDPHLPRPDLHLPTLVQPYWLLLRYAVLLRRSQYDAALLLRDDHWWGAALIALAGIPKRIGHAHPLCVPFLTDALPYSPAEHVSYQSLGIVEKLLLDEGRGQATDDHLPQESRAFCCLTLDFPLRFVPDMQSQIWANQWLQQHLAPNERLVAIHPGASGPTKAWPTERWAAFADALAAQNDLRIVFTGGPDEAGLVAEVAAQMRYASLSVAGKTNLHQLAALLSHTALTIGGDTGPLHVAVSQGGPTIHLFGPSDPGRFGPWGDPERNLVIQAGLSCSPCSCFDACPRHTDPAECMQHIELAPVLRAAHTLLRKGVEKPV
ncbi:MAG: glycosyltransferase family 9 protein [Oscillochloris sp.]|nr:glycosyltransferase family 9 protein [Oscillochloris sp.]